MSALPEVGDSREMQSARWEQLEGGYLSGLEPLSFLFRYLYGPFQQ